MSNIALLDQFLTAPFQRFCGLEVVEAHDGCCRAKLTVTNELTNLSNMLHGGVIHSMLDVVSFVAAMTVMVDEQYPVTHNINISVYRPVAVGESIEFFANVRQHGKRNIVTHCEIINTSVDKKPRVAEGFVTKTILNQSLHNSKGV